MQPNISEGGAEYRWVLARMMRLPTGEHVLRLDWEVLPLNATHSINSRVGIHIPIDRLKEFCEKMGLEVIEETNYMPPP